MKRIMRLPLTALTGIECKIGESPICNIIYHSSLQFLFHYPCFPPTHCDISGAPPQAVGDCHPRLGAGFCWFRGFKVMALTLFMILAFVAELALVRLIEKKLPLSLA